MPSPNHDCRCYWGDPCTKTTMCYVQDVEKDLQDRIERLEALVKTGVDVVDDFLPNIGNCALQDYGRLNQFLIDAHALEKT